MSTDKQELIREVKEAVADAGLAELEKMDQQRIKMQSPREVLKQLFRGLRDPQPVEENIIPVSPMPVMLPKWPKLKVRFDYAKGGEAQEWIVVNNGNEEAPYHAGGWYTVWPPSVPASTTQTQTLESHIEKLKADGVRERPKEDWERRKESVRK
jgi:hypothetical protein